MPLLTGNDSFVSETLFAYELGWRAQVEDLFSASVSTFYNDYDDLRTTQPGPPPTGFPITVANSLSGHTYGVEVALDGRVTRQWKMRGGYTYLRKDLTVDPGATDLSNGTSNSNDPEHQILVQSMLDLPADLQFDTVIRFVDALDTPHVPSYTGLDLRLAWLPDPHLELSLVGQNLIQTKHPEFTTSSTTPPNEIERSGYGKIAVRW